MKTIIKLILLFTTTVSFSQENGAFISTGFDMRNAIVGSNATSYKPAIDVNISLHGIYNKFELSIFYENFNRITFQSYGFTAGSNTKTLITNLYACSSFEGGFIVRTGNSSYPFFGGNIELRYMLNEKLALGLLYNLRYRTDLLIYNNDNLRASLFLNIFYKIK